MEKSDITMTVITILTIISLYWTSITTKIIKSHLLFEIIIGFGVIFIVIFYSLYMGGYGNKISLFILRSIRTILPGKSFSSEEQAAEFLTDYLPYNVFVILSLFLFLILLSDLFVAKIDDVIYGLVLDGIGAVLLGSDIFLDTKQLKAGEPFSLAEDKYNPNNSTYHFWGLIFLFLGFFLQILAILIDGFAIT